MEPEMEDEEALPPHVIEAARSGRSKCKTCRKAIAQGALRLGVLVEGPFGAGHMWHHLACAAKQRLDEVEAAYAEEAWRCAKVPVDPEELPPLEELRGLAEKAAVEREKKAATKKRIPYAELAPSGRSKCKQSGEPIPLGAVRVVLGKEASFGNQTRTAPFAVLPEHVRAALEDPEIAMRAEDLADELRANSDIEPDALEDAIKRIGL